MDTVVASEVATSRETDRQLALLTWARTRIDRIASLANAGERIEDLLDFMAHFTREYFGFQERLLTEAAAQREYLLERSTAHAEIRSRLAQIYADAANGDPAAAKRLSSLCHELWLDIQTQQDEFSAVLRDGQETPRLRQKPRLDTPPFMAMLRFDD